MKINCFLFVLLLINSMISANVLAGDDPLNKQKLNFEIRNETEYQFTTRVTTKDCVDSDSVPLIIPAGGIFTPGVTKNDVVADEEFIGCGEEQTTLGIEVWGPDSKSAAFFDIIKTAGGDWAAEVWGREMPDVEPEANIGLVEQYITLFNPNKRHSETAQLLHISYLGCVGQPADIEYWVAELAFTGGDINALVASLLASNDFEARFPNELSDEDFIEKIYNDLFGRNADSAGMEYYLQALDQGGATRGQLFGKILGGASGVDAVVLENKAAVALAFNEVAENSGAFPDDYAIAESCTILAGVTDDPKTVIGAMLMIYSLF